MRNSICALLLPILLFPPMSAAQANIGLKDWGRVAKILPGTRVKVKLTQKGKKLKGKLVSSDENGIHVTLSDGSGRSIGRTSIREIQALHGKLKYAPLIGAAAGAIALGVPLGQSGDIVPLGVALFAGIGAAIGFGIGFGIEMGFRYSIVYEAP